jgi:hypothetical protein
MGTVQADNPGKRRINLNAAPRSIRNNIAAMTLHRPGPGPKKQKK